MLLLIRCLLDLSLFCGGSVFLSFFVVQYVVYFLVCYFRAEGEELVALL